MHNQLSIVTFTNGAIIYLTSYYLSPQWVRPNPISVWLRKSNGSSIDKFYFVYKSSPPSSDHRHRTLSVITIKNMNLSLILSTLLVVLCFALFLFSQRKRATDVATLKNDEFKPRLIYYNRVGKCGSRSLLTVVKEAAIENGFRFVSEMPLYTRFDETELVKNVSQLTTMPVFYTYWDTL